MKHLNKITLGQPISKGDKVGTLQFMCDVPAYSTGIVTRVYKSGWAKIMYGINKSGQRIIGVQPINNLTQLTQTATTKKNRTCKTK